MKSVRNLFVLIVVLTMAFAMTGESAFALRTFKVVDSTTTAVTVGATGASATNVTLLKGVIDSLGAADTLVAVRLKSCIQSEFAVSNLTVVKKTGATETSITTVPISSSFEEDSLLYISGLTAAVANGDTLIFRVNINSAQAAANAADYHGTGLAVTVLPDGIDVRNDDSLSSMVNLKQNGTVGTGGYGHSFNFDPVNCTGSFPAIFDLQVNFNFSASHIDTYDCGAEENFNIGDRLVLVISSPGEQVDSTSAKADLSAFGLSPTHTIPFRTGSGDWRDTVTIAAGAIDMVPPFAVLASMTDIYGNTDQDTVVYNSTGIDNVNPVIDSTKFLIWQNNVGPTDNAAVGDFLVLWVFTASSGFFEVADVVADVSRFVPGLTSEALTEVTTGAGVWRLTFELTDGMAKDLEEGADTAKVAVITVVDNACNAVVDTVDFLPALDLELPAFAATEYITLDDADNTGCTNLGDEVRVEADVTGTDDVTSVWANFFEGGLGGTTLQTLTDEGSDIWALDWTIGTADDPGDDPPSLQAKDANSTPTDAIYRVWVYIQDDAGNVDSTQTNLLLNTAGTAFVPLDSRRPTAIAQDSVSVIRLPGGELALRWRRSAPAQAGDANTFYVYVDSTGAAIDYDNVFGTTFNNEFGDPNYNFWYSGPLTHNKTYRFSIRTRDDCGNFEFNTSIYEGIPDAQAPTACVVFPTTGGNYGPNNTLTITAVSPDADIDAAYAVYRLIDQGDGNPGPWINYPLPSDDMDQDGQTFQYTIDLGTDPSTAGTYELLILGVDEVGNELSLADAEDACGYYQFTWNPISLTCDVLTINDAFAPQTPCGFNVTRTPDNEAVVTIVNPDAGDFYTVDVWVQYDNVKTRIDYAKSTSLPYTFNFSASDWPKTVGGPLSNTMWVEITDERSGNYCETSVQLCVPDLIAPQAYIADPAAYQCIPIVRPAGDPVDIEVAIDPTAYDGNDAVRAELFYSLDGTLPGTKIGEAVFQTYGDYTWATIQWDNSDMTEGYVWLYAVVWDQVNNSYTTPFVRVCLDGTWPEMTLSIKDQVTYGCNGQDVKWRVGSNRESVDLVAELKNLDGIDITDVIFFYQRANDPEVVDIRDFWNWIGRGNPANNNSIWTRTWDISELDCGYDYRIRVAVRDAAGNTMLDMDGDGYFDDYTFDDAMDNGAGTIMYLDCGAPSPAISMFETTGEETRTWTNPSGDLNGSGDVFAKMGETIRVQTITQPEDDTCEVFKVDYYLCGTYVGTSTDNANWWQFSFDPFALGVLDAEDVADGEYECSLEARMFDRLGQWSSDYIDVYFLDTTPANVLITDPGDGSYVCGEVELNLGIFYGHDLKKVTWYYWPAAGGPKVKIAEVYGNEEPDLILSAPQWGASWNIALNNPANGDYYIGAELCDIADNVTNAEDGAILVHVNCNLPSVVISSPANGGFFCADEYFCATPNANNGAPIDNVMFQYKPFWEDNWNNFDQSADFEAPWCMNLNDGFDGNEIENEGFYQFRAVVTNQADITTYSEPIMLFFDNTDPLARPVWVTDGVDTFDVENENDPIPSFKVGTKKLTFKFRAQDNQSSWGPSPLYNSGLGDICANNVCVPIEADAEGYFTVEWDMSGESAGMSYWGAEITDAVGCNSAFASIPINLYAGEPTLALVAGCWRGKLFGIAEYDASSIFQYRQNGGNWIQISSNNSQDGKWLLNDDWSYTPDQWSVHYTDWVPANGTYEVRLLSDNGYGYDESLSPIVTIVVTDEGCEVTGAPANFGPGSIERNLENGCDNLEGLATIGSNYGMPYGVAVAYNVPLESWSFDLIPFTALNQQGGITRYSGSFYFDALVDDGFGEGRTYFVDYDGTEGWSKYQTYNTFWVTRDFGTGGPVTFQDVTVEIPAEWTDYTGTDASALAIWKSKLARPSVWQDWEMTPVGDNNSMMTYITDPSCNDLCGDDQQYAIVTMQYNNTTTTPSESLTVAWWDGEGNWNVNNIFFPSTVRGFYRENGQNWVQFAVTCFGDGGDGADDAWYSVVKRTKYDGQGLVTRMQMVPYCDPYTNGYPDIWYQFTEPFQYQIDWNTLEVYLDGVRIFARGYLSGIAQPKAGEVATTALDEGSPQWSFYIDEVSAQLHISRNSYGEYDGPDSNDYGSSYYTPIPCGDHELYIRIEDEQARPQFIRDHFTVDCSAPDVDFANGFVTANPTITFTIDDEGSEVDWSEVYVDVYFVTKMDTTDGGPDGGSPKERMAFIQTFFPAQIQDYLQADGRTVIIPTTYDLDDERGLYVVIFNGTYNHSFNSDEDYYYYCYYGNCGDPSSWSNFDYYYDYSNGVEDCVGNNTSPHVQFFVVDREGATITLQGDADACPLVFQIADDGSGVDEVEIYQGGDLLTEGEQEAASDVDQSGEWYLSTTGNGATLYYCPGAASYEIRVTDNSGRESSYFGSKVGPLVDGDVHDGWAGPSPFDPAKESFAFHVTLEKAAENVTIRIFNMGSELISTINAGSMGAGEHAIVWTGRTDGGTMVAQGGYFAEVTATGAGSTGRTVIRFGVVEK